MSLLPLEFGLFCCENSLTLTALCGRYVHTFNGRVIAMKIKSQVTAVQAATPQAAAAHFQARLTLETDCWDVHHSLANDVANFVLLDVRSESLFKSGHVPSAIHLPHSQIRTETLPQLPTGGIYVVYCAGPHCNGANKAAIKIALLGLPVKEMIGGIEGWKDEGFELVTC